MTTVNQIKQIQDILFTKVIESGMCPKIDMSDLIEQCGLCDTDMEKMSLKKKNPVPSEMRCMARTWGGGLGTQCSYKKKEGEDFCGQHLKNGWEKHGRIDEEAPDSFNKSKTKKPKNGENMKVGPKKNLSAFMFFRKEKTKEYQENNPKINKQSELAKIMGADWKEMSDEDKLPYKKMEEEDKKRYAEELKLYKDENVDGNDVIQNGVVDKPKSTKPEKEEEKKNQEAEAEAEVEAEAEEEEEEEEEVSVVPYKYKGNEYLLDVDSGKVYNTELEFVGKKVGKKIDFDADNSSDEEE